MKLLNKSVSLVIWVNSERERQSVLSNGYCIFSGWFIVQTPLLLYRRRTLESGEKRFLYEICRKRKLYGLCPSGGNSLVFRGISTPLSEPDGYPACKVVSGDTGIIGAESGYSEAPARHFRWPHDEFWKKRHPDPPIQQRRSSLEHLLRSYNAEPVLRQLENRQSQHSLPRTVQESQRQTPNFHSRTSDVPEENYEFLRSVPRRYGEASLLPFIGFESELPRSTAFEIPDFPGRWIYCCVYHIVSLCSRMATGRLYHG